MSNGDHHEVILFPLASTSVEGFSLKTILRPFENVSDGERRAGVRLKPKYVWPGLYDDFRGVSVGLSFRPELAGVN